MIRRAGAALTMAILTAACSPSPDPSLTGQTPPPAIRPPAVVTVEAGGSVGCEWMLGCAALVAIEPIEGASATLSPEWYPANEIRLPVERHPEGDGGTMRVGSPATTAMTLGPGSYRVVGAWVYMDDLVSPPATRPGYAVISSTCLDDLVVPDGATMVEIAVEFSLDATCVIAVAAG